MRTIILFVVLLMTTTSSWCQNADQWRGPERDGIYPESNLLTTWPTEGPELLWKADSIGNGFSSPVVTATKIYVAGEIDSIGYIFCYSKSGSLQWKTSTGKEWTENFPGPRSTPTIIGDNLYYCSSMGEEMCLDAVTGHKMWSVNLLNDLHGTNIRFGYTDSPLIEGDQIFCFPGGKDTNIVSLNRFTGKLLWRSKAMGDSTAYCSPRLIILPGRKILVTLMIHHLTGIDISTGELLWSYKYERTGDIHCNTPLFDKGFIYCDDRGGNGIYKLELAADGKSVREVWRNFKAGNVQGGSIKIGDYLYGSRYRPGRFESIDARTGDVADSLKFGCGSTICADGLLYCYSDQGMMGLIKASKGKLSLVSSFKITEGTLEHFAHPVIRDGVLYVRHGKVLLAYNIRRK